jgi:hypothetical protein
MRKSLCLRHYFSVLRHICKEVAVTLEEIELELEFAELSRGQIVKLLSFVRSSGFDAKIMDRKLLMMGFEPLFGLYEDDESGPINA